ncbi:hypothetical protein [Halonatronum saccharophilum]|uniref:hypothetical protein n=1 Tax=Halonatronum saccharophilum TaxID=150060 RepID=UPI0004ACA17A|nr:hypothetical protein [Halonatronum saccharophilum]
MNRKNLLAKQGIKSAKKRDDQLTTRVLKKEDALEMNEGRQDHKGTPPVARNNLTLDTK